MIGQVRRIVHQARILLQLWMTTHVLLQILLRRLRERRGDTQDAPQGGSCNDSANLHGSSPFAADSQKLGLGRLRHPVIVDGVDSTHIGDRF
jgi:hypothetical protein